MGAVCSASPRPAAKGRSPSADSGTPREPPVAWMTSSGLATERLVCEFIKVLLKRKGVFDGADTMADAATLRAKYADTLATIKALHMNDGNYHKDGDAARKGRANRVTFFWDLELIDRCGLKRENIRMIMLYEKPWLFDRPGEDGKYDPQAPGVAGVSAADRDRYYALLAKSKEVVDRIRAGERVPVPAGEKSIADQLAEASRRLDRKHLKALNTWCDKVFEEYDLVVGQGGDVVMLNLAFQVSPDFTRRLVRAVREGNVVFATMSASTMACSKTMEMTGEILTDSLDNFSVSAKYLTGGFDPIDLDGGGIETNVLGALPLYKSPFAMRPHFSEAWLEKVLSKNKTAEEEFELEMGVEVDDDLVASSCRGLEVALQLLNVISANAKEQDNPVYLPMLDGQAIQCLFLSDREVFSIVPNEFGDDYGTGTGAVIKGLPEWLPHWRCLRCLHRRDPKLLGMRVRDWGFGGRWA